MLWRAVAGRELQREGAAARNRERWGQDLTEQVKTATNSIHNVPLMRAFPEGGGRLQAFCCRLDSGICQLFAYCLPRGDLLQVLK